MTTSPNRVALITGATGFIGSHLVSHLLSRGWQVHTLVRASSPTNKLDVSGGIQSHLYDESLGSVFSCLDASRPDIVFHIASRFIAEHKPDDVDSLIQSNVLFGSQLAEAMTHFGVKRLVNTGTSWQHFNDEAYNPVCLYAATKQALESILEYYVRAHDLRAITLELFDTYGPGDQRPKLMNALYMASITKQPLDMSPGEQLVDLVYIDDVISAYIAAAERLLNDQVQSHEHYAVNSQELVSLKELVALYASISGREISVNWGHRAYRAREVMHPWSKGQRLPHWKPKTSLSEGIRKTCLHQIG